MYILNNFRYRN